MDNIREQVAMKEKTTYRIDHEHLRRYTVLVEATSREEAEEYFENHFQYAHFDDLSEDGEETKCQIATPKDLDAGFMCLQDYYDDDCKCHSEDDEAEDDC